jgi:CHAT domain-containing protein/Flp pilus assembly protein TadD
MNRLVSYVLLASLAIAVFGCTSSFCLNQANGSEIPYFPRQLRFRESLASQSRVLAVREAVTQKVVAGRPVEFSITLAGSQFAQFVVEQHGSILLVSLYDPVEQLVIQSDSPAGGHGPIEFSVIAPSSGSYRLEVKSVDDWALPSDCEVSLMALRDPIADDQLQVKAQAEFAAGRTSFRNGKFQEATDAYLRSLSYWQTTQNRHWLALTHFALAEGYRLADKFKNQEQQLEETLRVVEQGLQPNDWRLQPSALNDLGALYGRTGRSQQAFDQLNRAFALYASHNDRRGQASALNNLAQAEAREGNYYRAREFVDRASALRLAENDKPSAAKLIGAVGAIYDRLGDPEQALNYSRQAFQKWEQIGEKNLADRRAVASVLSSIATANDKLGNWDEAFEYYDRALQKYDETDPYRAVTLDSKGELYAALGNPVRARECYEQALRILDANEKSDPDIKAGILVHLGQLSLTAGESPAAIKLFEQARDLGPGKNKLGDVLTNLGNALASSRSFEGAIASYQQALELKTSLNDRRGRALIFQKRGETYLLQGKLQEAANDFKSALPLWQEVEDQRGEAATFNNIARVEGLRGNLAEALAKNKEAIRIVESLRTNVSSRQLRTSYFATQENYYELDIDLLMQLSERGQRDKYWAAALEANEKSRARVLLEALNEAGVGRNVHTESADPRFSSMIEERLKLLSLLAGKAQARTQFLNGPHSTAQIGDLNKELADLSDKYDELDSRLRKQNPKFANLTKPQPASLDQIKGELDDDTILLEYALGEQHSYVWIVTRNSLDAETLAPGSEIESYALRVAEDLAARGRNVENENAEARKERVRKAENDYVTAAKSLSDAVLGPIAAKLNKKRLLIVADGNLQLIPFPAMPAPDTKSAKAKAPTLMIEKYEILNCASASVLVLQRKEMANRPHAEYALAVIADPVFGVTDDRLADLKRKQKVSRKPKTNAQDSETSRGLPASFVDSLRLARTVSDLGYNSPGEVPRLRFSGDEADAILKLAPPGESFSALGFAANRQTLFNPKLARYRIIHLATHGIMDPNNPELSGFLLSMVDDKGREQNGYIGLSEIYNLNLPADLVVLSACETGTGKKIKGEGLIALTRGFMYAGAASIVASLWKVDDRVTAALMTIFYQELLVNKLKPAAALRAAQRKLSLNKKWNQPHYWAGFVLQGEWR